MNPTPEQKAAIDEFPNHSIIKVDSVAGGGKAQPVYSLVKTPTGDREIGDLKIGDEVINSQGGISSIIGVHPQGLKETYKVTFRDKTFTKVCGEHLWKVKPISTSKGRFKVLSTKELLESGLKNNAGNMKFKIPLCNPVQYQSKHLPIDPYILGLMLGDGTFKSSPLCFSYHSQDSHLYTTLCQTLEKGLGIIFTGTPRNTSENGMQVALVHYRGPKSKNKITQYFNQFNFKVNKFIPEIYLTASVDQRLALLRGLMDTDGSVHLNRTTFCNSNPDIISGVISLVQSLGGVAIRTKIDSRRNNLNYTLNIKMDINPFSLPRKAERWSPSWKNPPSRYIESIELTGDVEECVCISVDAEDSLYLTNDFIVTHNSSLCKMAAHTYPMKSLYMAFNKTMANEMAPKMPDWVDCMTTHSLAYRAMASNIAHKLARPKGAYVNVAGTGLEVANMYKLSNIPHAFEQKTVFSKTAIGFIVLRTLRRFEASSDDALKLSHVPYSDLLKVVERSYKGYDYPLTTMREIVHDVRTKALEAAKDMWKDRKNPSSPVMITHDTYLKLYQLSKPQLPYEAIYLDEAQDTSDCVLDIIMSQKSSKIIVIGDEFQAIYQWRNAVNAMKKVEAISFPLTHSFRYGAAIASVATAVLQRAVEVKGLPTLQSVVKTAEMASQELVEASLPDSLEGFSKKYGKVTKIFRTNAALLDEAMGLLSVGVDNIEIRTDVKDFINMLWSAEALRKGDLKKVKHDVIVSYGDWKEFEEAGKDEPDVKRILGILKRYGSFLNVINTLQDYKAPAEAGIILTTAHKSKGLEWDHVVLADDFPDVEQIKGSQEETNLLYVACTRAILTLVTNTQVDKLMEEFGG